MMPDDHMHDDEAVIRAVTRGASPSVGRDPLARQLRAVRDELCRPPAATARWNHLAAMRRAVPSARRGPRNALAIAVATVGIVGVSTGLAAAGRLPAPAQAQAARLAEIVGVDLPDHDQSPAATNGEPMRVRVTANVPLGTPGRAYGASAAATKHPGVGRTPPGRSAPAPGAVAAPDDGPGRGEGTEHAPGQTGTAPGLSGSAPGQSGSAPGHTGTAPGQSGSAPGQSGSAPGQSGTAPGQSGSAPGHDPSGQKVTGPQSVPPGLDPAGPGNSEHASTDLDGTSPSDNAPGQYQGRPAGR